MEITKFPYAFSLEAVERTSTLVNSATDLNVLHLDQGVPWDEALDNQPWPHKVTDEINLNFNGRQPAQPYYVAATPLTTGRDALGGSWNNQGGSQPRSPRFAKLDFSSPEVLTAYVNYCEKLLAQFKPRWFAYAIEANELLEKSPDQFPAFVTFCGKVYTALKASHPDTFIFPTVTASDKANLAKFQQKGIEALMPYADMLAVSSYAFYNDSDTDPDHLGEHWFSRMAALAPGKPMAIAETGCPATRFQLEDIPIPFIGDDARQQRYVRFLLSEAQRLNMAFIVWFIAVDYEELWKTLQGSGAPSFFALWKNTGLWRADLTPRPALGSWQAQLAIPLQQP